MRLAHLVIKEIAHRKLNFALAVVAVAAATACLVGALTLLDSHDVRTVQILRDAADRTQRDLNRLEDDVRKAMLRLGFNIVILPKEQDLNEWHAQDYAESSMPEEYVERLAKSKIVTVQHLLPTLQQKVLWPEQKRSVILVGTRGEVPGGAKKAMVDPVAQGTIVLGYELHAAAGTKPGDEIRMFDRPFKVAACYPMRGNKDDITAWINLPEAQELLTDAQGRPRTGQINAILALECACAWADLPKVREEITRILPRTQVIERGSEALARAEARQHVAREAQAAMVRLEHNRMELRRARERLASVLVPVVMLGAAAWVGLLMLGNVRERRSEIGILRAMGVTRRKVLGLFLSKAIVTGLLGGLVGYGAGLAAGMALGSVVDGSSLSAAGRGLFSPVYALAILAAPLLAAIASYLPASLASQTDPAVVLGQE